MRTKSMGDSLSHHVFVSSMPVSLSRHVGQRTRLARLIPATKERPPIGWRGREMKRTVEVVRVRHGLLMVTILSDDQRMKAEVRWAGW